MRGVRSDPPSLFYELEQKHFLADHLQNFYVCQYLFYKFKIFKNFNYTRLWPLFWSATTHSVREGSDLTPQGRSDGGIRGHVPPIPNLGGTNGLVPPIKIRWSVRFFGNIFWSPNYGAISKCHYVLCLRGRKKISAPNNTLYTLYFAFLLHFSANFLSHNQEILGSAKH